MTNNIEIYTIPTISIQDLLSIKDGINVMVPLDEVTLNSFVINNVKWRNMLDDYVSQVMCIGNIRFKRVNLKAQIHQNGKMLISSNYGKIYEVINRDSSQNVGMTVVTGTAVINGYIQTCLTLTLTILRNQITDFINDYFPHQRWESVYENILSEKDGKGNYKYPTAHEFWKIDKVIDWGNIIPFFNKFSRKLNVIWGDPNAKNIREGVVAVKQLRNRSSHHGVDQETLRLVNSDKGIPRMKEIIKNMDMMLSVEDIVYRCGELDYYCNLINEAAAVTEGYLILKRKEINIKNKRYGRK